MRPIAFDNYRSSEKADDWEAGITSATVGAAFLFSFVGGFVTDRSGLVGYHDISGYNAVDGDERRR